MAEGSDDLNEIKPAPSRGLRVVGAWLGLAAALLAVGFLYSRYRAALPEWEAAQNKPTPSQIASETMTAKPSATSTKTPSSTKGAGVQTTSVEVVASVTFRQDPSTSANALRDLRVGEKLLLLGKFGNWYRVTDSGGAVGWVTSSPKYTKLVQR